MRRMCDVRITDEVITEDDKAMVTAKRISGRAGFDLEFDGTTWFSYTATDYVPIYLEAMQ